MLTLHFNKSRSAKLTSALKLSAAFSEYIDEGNSVSISLPIKEVFEKWDMFNELFWIVVDWKGTALKYEDMTYYSHLDKTQIFYALQQSRYKWIQFVQLKVSQLYKVETGEKTLSELNREIMTDKTVDYLLDLYTIGKSR